MWPINERAGGAEYDTISARIAEADLPAAHDSREGKIIVRFVSVTGAAFLSGSIAKSAALIHAHSQ
jgi:hypothetical protein